MLEFESTQDAVRATVKSLRATGKRIGLVPTMGALHEGHASLFERAAAECDVVIASIFVNPLQFNEQSDFDNYPRTLERDGEIAREHGVSLVFSPSRAEMFPESSSSTTVEPGALGTVLEGASRPGHFAGVATIVTKLLLVVAPDRAYFGEKDFQQLAVIRQLVADLSIPVAITGCPTVRDVDGCALSSRNVRLSPQQRERAAVLSEALLAGRQAYSHGEQSREKIEEVMRAHVSAEPLAQLDYAVARDPHDLGEVMLCADDTRLLIAATFGDIRLIDNMSIA